jgi:CheY-like chemotaxis protein
MSDLVNVKIGGARRPTHKQSVDGMNALPLRVLCVDDEPSALSMLARVLEADFEIVTQDSLVGALSLLERDGDFAVVIAGLSTLDGVKFLESVRTISPTTTRLVMTASPVIDSSSLPLDAAFRFISKPCPADALLQMVRDAANYHVLVATGPAQPVEAHALPMSIARRLAIPIAIHEQAPPVARVSAPLRVGLRMAERTVELLPGVTIVGRSRTCHIPLSDPQISRRHACFSNTGRELSVRNVSSTNGVQVNGTSIEPDSAHRLAVGDRVTLGDHEIEVCALGDYNPSIEPTHRICLPLEVVDSSPSNDAATLATLAQVADKYFLLGQSREAERIVRPLLEGLLRYCVSGQRPLATDLDLAVGLTLRIAETTRAGAWIDYLFDLFSALEQPMTSDVVDGLYRVIPGISGARIASFRGYLDTLRRLQDGFGPGERFLVRRIQGLETRLVMSAHV